MSELSSLIWIFPLTITLHNLEEALWLPQWSKDIGKYHKPVNKNEFHFALICVTIMAYLASFLYSVMGDTSLIKYVYFGYVGGMLINAIFPHLIATIALKKYAPGVITGVLLNIPCYTILIAVAIDKKVILLKEVIISTGIVGGIILISLPILFRVGKRFVKY